MSTSPTVKASDLEGADWFTSSYSNAGGECVETADFTTSHGQVAIRDSKNPTGPTLLMPTATFAGFIHTIREEIKE